MSRTTQFVGLTSMAREFVKDATILPSDRFTLGMFQEMIPLGRWSLVGPFKCRENACIREVVQASPWSSGPMIFTCLEVDYGNGGISRMLQWIEDPNVTGEYDQVSGRFWV